MKSWSVLELENVVASLKALDGARLQEIKTSGNDVVLGFYSIGHILWLWIDLNTVRPGLLPWTELPLNVPSKKTPMQLFLRAHFDGRILHGVQRLEEIGRAVALDFGPGYRIEIRLFPHGVNLTAEADGKVIHWQKPLPLPPPLAPQSDLSARDLEELREQWLAHREGTGKKGGKAKSKEPSERIPHELDRRRKALVKVNEELARKSELPWRDVGLWVQKNQSLEVPAEWTPFVDKRRKLSWNIEQCFAKAREVEGKLHGTEQRRARLIAEIAKLEQENLKPRTLRDDKPQVVDPLKNSGLEGRSLKLSEEITAFAGKNAGENMKLLRRARPWDFWLHVQDQPGAHVIVFRNKSTSVSEARFREVIGWMLKIQLGAKFAKHSREKFKIIIAEARHVRPIKGDRLGRVHYQNERILIYQIP